MGERSNGMKLAALVDARLERSGDLSEQDGEVLARVRDGARSAAAWRRDRALVDEIVKRIAPLRVPRSAFDGSRWLHAEKGPRLALWIGRGADLTPTMLQAVCAHRAALYAVPWRDGADPLFNAPAVLTLLGRRLGIDTSAPRGSEELGRLPVGDLVDAFAAIDTVSERDVHVVVTAPDRGDVSREVIVAVFCQSAPTSESWVLDLLDGDAAPTCREFRRRLFGENEASPAAYRNVGRFSVLTSPVCSSRAAAEALGPDATDDVFRLCATSAAGAGTILSFSSALEPDLRGRTVIEGDGEWNISIRAVQQFGPRYMCTPPAFVWPDERLAVKPILFARYGEISFRDDETWYAPRQIYGMYTCPDFTSGDEPDWPDGTPGPHRRAQTTLDFALRRRWPKDIILGFLKELRGWTEAAPWA